MQSNSLADRLTNLATELSVRHSQHILARRAREMAFEAERKDEQIARLRAELAKAHATVDEIARDAREDMEREFGLAA